MIWESLIIVSIILVFFFTRNENKKREEQEIIEDEKNKREDERVLSKKNEREERKRIEEERIEEERVLREKNKREDREKREQERLVKKKELEEKRKKKEFWFDLGGLETEDELDKVFEKLGFESELTPPSNDEGIDHVLNGEIVVQTKNQQKKVTRPDLQKFWGSWKDSHKKGIFISIHGFTNTCEEFIKDKPILLYDVDDVIGMSEGNKPEWNE
jgi:restriction endonuclease Mrr